MGKAWLYLSKAYQNFGSKGNQAEYKEKSEAALFRHVTSHPCLFIMCLQTIEFGCTPITVCTVAGPFKEKASWH